MLDLRTALVVTLLLAVGPEVLELAVLHTNITARSRVKAVEPVHHGDIFQSNVVEVPEKKNITRVAAKGRRTPDEGIFGTGPMISND